MSEASVSPADAAARIAALEVSLARANAALASRDLLIDTLRGQIARLRRMQFGASSEKLGREIEQLELALEELETERDAPVPKVADSGIAFGRCLSAVCPDICRARRSSMSGRRVPAPARTVAVRCAPSARTRTRCSTSCRCAGASSATSAPNTVAGPVTGSSRHRHQ